MTKQEAKDFINKLQTTSSIALYSAVIFFYDSLARMTVQRNILSTDYFEVDDWLAKTCKQYKLANKTYVAYLNGHLNDSNNGETGSILTLFDN